MKKLIITSETILEKEEDNFLNSRGFKNLELSTYKGNIFNMRVADNSINVDVSRLVMIRNKNKLAISAWLDIENILDTELLVGTWLIEDVEVQIVDNN